MIIVSTFSVELTQLEWSKRETILTEIYQRYKFSLSQRDAKIVVVAVMNSEKDAVDEKVERRYCYMPFLIIVMIFIHS
jgi:hypothetical protein